MKQNFKNGFYLNLPVPEIYDIKVKMAYSNVHMDVVNVQKKGLHHPTVNIEQSLYYLYKQVCMCSGSRKVQVKGLLPYLIYE
jgi:hypothetical protein